LCAIPVDAAAARNQMRRECRRAGRHARRRARASCLHCVGAGRALFWHTALCGAGNGPLLGVPLASRTSCASAPTMARGLTLDGMLAPTPYLGAIAARFRRACPWSAPAATPDTTTTSVPSGNMAGPPPPAPLSRLLRSRPAARCGRRSVPRSLCPYPVCGWRHPCCRGACRCRRA
jgi:hypothetical protein